MDKVFNTLTCVYCGKEYPSNTPPSGADVEVLTIHIRQCEKHPMRKLEEENKKLKEALKTSYWKCKDAIELLAEVAGDIAVLDGEFDVLD